MSSLKMSGEVTAGVLTSDAIRDGAGLPHNANPLVWRWKASRNDQCKSDHMIASVSWAAISSYISVMEQSGLDKALALLARWGWFGERSQDFRTAIAAMARLQDYATGQPLYLFGDPPNGIFGLVSGALDVSIPRSDGLELTAYRANPGFWVGDLALFSGETRIVSLYAAEATRVVHLPVDRLRRLVRENPRYYEDFYALTHQNVALTLRVLADLTTSPSEARVGLRLLLDSETQPEPHGWFHVTQTTLAQMVALSVPSLRRILHKLEKAGLIEASYGRVRVLDRNGLLKLCHDTAQLHRPARHGDIEAKQHLPDGDREGPHAVR